MRYFLIACVALAVVVFGGVRAAPWVMDWWVDSSCPAGIADPDCYRSIRTMGHIWTKKGDLDRGGTWYLRGARAGDRESMFHLAWVYEEVVIDHYQEQARAFQRDSENKSPSPILTARLRDASPDEKELFLKAAAAWYRKSARAGFAPSMNNLGTLYAIGYKGRPDHRTALGWYLKAARTGNPIGARNAMGAYSAGHGTARNFNEAFKWSLWRPSDGLTDDLKPLTLRRTRLMAVPIRTDEDDDIMRWAAEEGKALELTIQPRTRRDLVPPSKESGVWKTREYP